ncbi:hypothetical protein TRSC58_07596 [Trypanosoma rangeli SC58]|uniref:Uncharacterized protein n=1 Tax=Trypanosoma rangeli SC58 TaxID=429131 RepID=A0A061IRT4_TRYRA|nr:hypothetical protein TRSC58_07596 [Trypanosoma rangeli SC58]
MHARGWPASNNSNCERGGEQKKITLSSVCVCVFTILFFVLFSFASTFVCVFVYADAEGSEAVGAGTLFARV